MRRIALTALILLAAIGGAQAQPASRTADYGHDAASQRLALHYDATHAMAAQAREGMRATRVEFGRPQRQMR